MASERIQRRIDSLLDEADEAVSKLDWATATGHGPFPALIPATAMPSPTWRRRNASWRTWLGLVRNNGTRRRHLPSPRPPPTNPPLSNT